MRAAESFRVTSVIILTVAYGTIGGHVSSVVGETENGKRLTTSRTDGSSGDAAPQEAVRSEESATVTRRDVEFDRVRAVAQASGSVRVIVQLDVPNLNALTTASYAAKEPGAIAATDGQLSGAIGNVRGGELAKLAGTQHTINRTYASVPFIALTVSEQALNVLRASPGVLGINEDHLAAPTLNNTVNITGASASWAQGFDGSGWYVAILDTGIRDTHHFFAGKNIVQACFALGQDGAPGAGNCPNGLSSDTTSPHAAQHHATSPSNTHGTHVAGIATGNDPTRIPPLYGIARGADLIAIQIFSQFIGSPSCGGGNCVLTLSSDQIAGLDYVFSLRSTHHIASVNMSIGGGQYFDQATCDADNAGVKAAIDNLRGAGIATVIASGNNGFCGSISGPGCISSAVAVGATTDSDDEASFSNWDPTMLDIYAPGVSILSSVNTSDTSYDGTFSGTSMATPHVAGAWAILKQADPWADVATILSALQTTGASVAGRCVVTPTQRRIQIDRALGTRRIKFIQPPDASGEDTASSLDGTDLSPNTVVADDFVSDGRPITAVRWWGSNLSTGSEGNASHHNPPLSPLGKGGGRGVVVLPAVASSQPIPQSGYAKNAPVVDPQTTRYPAPADNAVAGPGCVGDTCAAAISVGSLPFNAAGNSCACTNHYDESCNSAPGSPDVVYAYTPAADECVNISMCNGSDYDAVMFVYENACTPGTSVACNDDGCASGGPSLIPNLILTGGDTYYVVVSGWNGTGGVCGNYVLDISLCAIECGNGFVEPGEQCDPPNGLTCDSACQVIPNPPIDGWLISFHEPLALGASPSPPLALYFCEAANVAFAATSLGACDAHPARKYDVDLADCCLVHSYPDSRNGLTPGQPGAFLETECFNYDLDIQAVIGHTYLSAGGVCTTEVLTGNTATTPFWGWHTTSIERGLRPALQSVVSMSGPDWLYGPWSPLTPDCSAPNMAFQLLTDTNGSIGDCNDNGVPDSCESAPDCQPNNIFDECDIANGTSNDCNNNGIPDECDIASGAPDCQPNGIPDSCELVGNDANGNGQPDDCDPTPPISAGPPNRNRSLGLSSAAGPGATRALRVTMVDLQNPVPPNLPQYPPPNFSAYEAGPTCTDPYGCVRWVGPPNIYLESQDSPGTGNYRAARLQCTPHYQDWTTAGLFYIAGAEIVPSSTYDVHAFAASCAGMEGSCLDVSLPLRLTTARSGDIAANFNPPSTSTQPDAIDVAQLVNKLKNLPGALVKAIAQLQPNLPELNADINALDVVAVVDGVKQKAYAFSGPCPCPSLVTCGTTGCTSPTICVSTYGTGAMCVKTCSGGGPNDGLPCINNSHCPGGTCGSPFCRDACGRCTP